MFRSKSKKDHELQEVYQQYFKLLCYEARGYLSDNLVIEELVNDVFIRFWQLEKEIPQDGIRHYLIKSIHHACISYLRHLKVMENMQKEMSERTITDNTIYSLDENPLDYVITQELEKKIDQAIQQLPPQYKRAFELSRFHDFSYQDIAQQMNISINTVKTYMKNALEQLRRVLSD